MNWFRNVVILVSFVQLTLSACAQDAIRTGSIIEPSASVSDINSTRSSEPTRAIVPGNQDLATTPFSWGAVEIHPSLGYSRIYSTGVQAAPDKSVNTYIGAFSVGLSLTLDDQWSISYAPTWMNYSAHALHNSANEHAMVSGRVLYADWIFDVQQDYTHSADPLVQTAGQTEVTSYNTSSHSSYRDSRGTLFEVEASQRITSSSVISTYYDWSADGWIHYRLSPAWDFAGGGGGGYIINDRSTGITVLQALGRVTWKPGTKLAVDFLGGPEFKNFSHGAGQFYTPMFTGSLTYHLTSTTDLLASAARRVEPALVRKQISEDTGFDFSLDQRILQHFHIGARANRTTIAYLATDRQLTRNRSDRIDSMTLKLRTTVFRRVNLEARFTRTLNHSDLVGFEFSTNAYGISAELAY